MPCMILAMELRYFCQWPCKAHHLVVSQVMLQVDSQCVSLHSNGIKSVHFSHLSILPELDKIRCAFTNVINKH